jgi:DNA-directed RNA polymerase specialized sigma24 family protein
MFPVREVDFGEQQYQENLALIRQRILNFTLRRLVPREAGFADAEEIAQSCIAVLWERYPQKRDLAEMTAIAIGTARHKIGQFRRNRERDLRAPETVSVDDLFEQIAARETADRFLLAMLRLQPRCRELLRLKLVEQLDYSEIRLRMGIAGNIYEMAKRCHRGLLRLLGAGSQ